MTRKNDEIDEHLCSVYTDLKKLAASKLSGERIDITLSATGLVHEVYQRMSNRSASNYQSPTHFIAICSIYMRRILVDYARKRQRAKRGGKLERVTISAAISTLKPDYETILDVHRALLILESSSPNLAKIVEYRFFAGLTYDEIAQVSDLSIITVKRRWALAKARLLKLLQDEESNYC
ncbi:MAG: ECF-type sigma factor [Bacteroidota bacterium]